MSKAQRCQDETCDVHETGTCKLGHQPVTVCPNADDSGEDDEPDLGEPEAHDGDDDLEEAAARTESAYEQLYDGEALDIAAVHALADNEPVRIALLAGAPKAGKTTIISELFHAFLRGPYGECSFCGCRSLMGFERRCHLARMSSMSAKPETQHTSVGPPTFLALELRRGERARFQLVLGDLSGESYRRAIGSSEEAKSLGFISRIPRLILVVDGARIANGEGLQAKADASRLLRRLREAGILPAGLRLYVVISKMDRIRAAAGLDFDSFLGVLRTAVDLSLGEAMLDISYHFVSARNTADPGMVELFGSLTGPAARQNFDESCFPSSTRWMGRFSDCAGDGGC